MFRAVCVALLAIALVPAAARAGHPSIPNFMDVLRMHGGDPQIPPAWAGIWHSIDTTRTCGTQNVLRTDDRNDTLCVGTYDPDTSSIDFNCTGTITDTNVNLTCTGSLSFKGCTINFTFTTVGTRNGDTADLVETLNQSFNPPLCAFIPDSCEETTRHVVRLGPITPGDCPTTPAVPTTWGSLKIRYR
jgi:hypothetical protein